MTFFFTSRRALFAFITAVVAHAFLKHKAPNRQAVVVVASVSSIAPDREGNYTYTEEQLLLRGKRGTSAAFAVVLPKGFDASLSQAEKDVADRIEEAKTEGKTDLDLLKEELRKTLDGWQ